MEFNEKIRKKLKNLPDTPGVYIMRDADDNVIYVGKALVLKNRVRQYFTNETQLPKVAAMIARVGDFEYIITDTEMEALVLESNLVKQYKPYYNILLKDDKHFPYIRIDMRDAYPRVEVVRSVKKDGAKYYGPFIAAHVMYDVLDHIYRLYPLRSCKKDIGRAAARGERPCLNYEMGRCVGPCTGKVGKEEYGGMVREVAAIIAGNGASLKKDLTKRMREASEQTNYELAATLRDKIALVDRIREKQRAGFPNLDDKDIFAVETGAGTAVVQAFLFRDGKLNYAEKFYIDYDQEEKSEIMNSFLMQYYMDKTGVPRRIYTDPGPEDAGLIEQWLTGKRGAKVVIAQARRGDNKKLQDLARKNARDAINQKEGRDRLKKAAAENLARELELDFSLRRIECYDISNTQGTDNVSSMVVFTDGKPDRKQYRRFKIKSFEGANDFASMEETLARRLTRGLKGDPGFAAMPDLIIVDGGKGQLSSAMDALASVGCENLAIVSLAKKEEEIFTPHSGKSILLKQGSPEFRLVTAIRDEAHRFAVTFHRKLREKRIHKSALDGIEGVGESRKKTLVRHFGSVKNIKAASLDEIKDVRGIPVNVAEAVYDHFHETTMRS
jgi:excinuclease ABC subunit C